MPAQSASNSRRSLLSLLTPPKTPENVLTFQSRGCPSKGFPNSPQNTQQQPSYDDAAESARKTRKQSYSSCNSPSLKCFTNVPHRRIRQAHSHNQHPNSLL